MRLFCFHNLDNETNGAELRAATRSAHLELAAGLGDQLRMAGPLLSEDGAMIGSVFLVEADDLASAKALAEQDPYNKAGVFDRVDVRETKWLIGQGKRA
tara:strand:+ start:220 stop:516 length:297 start_codon:yes stop_codon:yes gene_type:complete